MAPDTEIEPTPMWMVVVGWIFTLLPAAVLIASAVLTKFMAFKPDGGPDVGWSGDIMLGLGIVEVGCTVLYLFPRTAVLGAILLTGYLGGAVATHLRIGDMFLPPMLIGVLLWFGLFLRDARLRACLPWRRDPSVPAPGGFLAAVGKILLTLLVLVGVVAALVEATPADYRISRTATMDVPASKVFEQVNDFHKWDAWSPWEKIDPAYKKTYDGPETGKGAILKWSGNDQAGEGTMTITESQPNERIKIKLQIMKPGELSADSQFTFTPDGDKTVVRWTMTGHSDDLLGKAKVVVMQFIIGQFYDEGLKNLKTVVEKK